jgi:hypothetical protein
MDAVQSKTSAYSVDMLLLLTLTADLEAKLWEQAASAGKDDSTFARDVLEERLHGPLSVDEILAPFHKQVGELGMTDEEMDEFYERLRDEVWQDR